jgi:death on curing protein
MLTVDDLAGALQQMVLPPLENIDRRLERIEGWLLVLLSKISADYEISANAPDSNKKIGAVRQGIKKHHNVEPHWLEVREIHAIHSEILAEFGGDSGVLMDIGTLESTLNKPKNLYNYNSNVSLYDLAANYGYTLVQSHCFVDGNKTIALIAIYKFLSINGIELVASKTDAVSFFLDWARSLNIDTQDENMQLLTSWLQLNSKKIDPRNHV